MQRKLLLCAWAVLALVPCTAARAASTVEELSISCKAPGDTCRAYIAGAGEVMLSVNSMCGQATYGAMKQAFVNWADKHPEKWGYPAVWGVITALSETSSVPAPATPAGASLASCGPECGPEQF